MIVYTRIRSYAKKRPKSATVARSPDRNAIKTLVIEPFHPPRDLRKREGCH